MPSCFWYAIGVGMCCGLAAACGGAGDYEESRTPQGAGGSGGACEGCVSPPREDGGVLIDAGSDRTPTDGSGGQGTGGDGGEDGSGGSGGVNVDGSAGGSGGGDGGPLADGPFPESSSDGASQAEAEPPSDSATGADGPAPPEDAGNQQGVDAGLGPGAEAGASDGGEDPQGDICSRLDPSKPLVLIQSADDSNSMASPVIARSMIRRHTKVPARVIRTYEFLNYYNVLYADAAPGHVRVVPQMRPGRPGEYIVQIGVQSEKAPSPRRPMNITFALDNSGSMQGEPLWLEKKAIRAMAASMRAGDRVSIVAWNTTQWVLLDNHVVSGPSDPTVIAALGQLVAQGTTDLHSGLAKTYEVAKKHYDRTVMNRVVLMTDGIANVGVVDAELIAQESHAADGEGIYLVGVGVGAGFQDSMMDTITDKGRGAYVYLDDEAEATRMFATRFDETMEVAVRDVRVELTLPWYFTLEATSAEQSSTDPSEVEPQYLAPSDAIVLHDTFIPCSPSVMDASDTIAAKALYSLPIHHTPGEDATVATVGELLAGDAAQLYKGAAIVAWAEALRRLDTMGHGPAAIALLDEVLGTVAAADPSGADADLAEIAELAQQYKTLF